MATLISPMEDLQHQLSVLRKMIKYLEQAQDEDYRDTIVRLLKDKEEAEDEIRVMERKMAAALENKIKELETDKKSNAERFKTLEASFKTLDDEKILVRYDQWIGRFERSTVLWYSL